LGHVEQHPWVCIEKADGYYDDHSYCPHDRVFAKLLGQRAQEEDVADRKNQRDPEQWVEVGRPIPPQTGKNTVRNYAKGAHKKGAHPPSIFFEPGNVHFFPLKNGSNMKSQMALVVGFEPLYSRANAFIMI
jgi:hypothetical protein